MSLEARSSPLVAQLAEHPTAVAVTAVVASIATFMLLKLVAPGYPSLAPWLVLASALFAAMNFRWQYRDLPRPVALFVRAFAICLIPYLFAEPYDVPMTPGLLGDSPSIQYLYSYGPRVGLIAAVMACIRPSFILVPAIVIWQLRNLNALVTGFAFSTLDVENVMEVIIFTMIGTFLVRLASLVYRRITPNANTIELRALQSSSHLACMAVLVVAIGGHLGNYFYSFVAKLALDGGPLSWVLDNQTYLGVLAGIERGAFPFAAWPTLTQSAFDVLKVIVVPMNIVTLLAQGAAIFAFSNRKLLIGITVLYDVFHIGVYLCFGLLFFKWMILNTIIVIVISRMRDEEFTPLLKLLGSCAVIAGTLIFTTARLAWYDSPALLSPFFEAQTKDGSRYRVPPAFFRSASYQASHARYYVPPSDTHFPSTRWASFTNYQDLLRARQCQLPLRSQPDEERFGPLERVGAYLRANHEAILRQSDAKGLFNYYAYPHHHVASIALDDPFYGVDKRQVVSYSYVLESVCLSLENGRLQRKVLARNEYAFSLNAGTHVR